jgi:hypothetical protein
MVGCDFISSVIIRTSPASRLLGLHVSSGYSLRSKTLRETAGSVPTHPYASRYRQQDRRPDCSQTLLNISTGFTACKQSQYILTIFGSSLKDLRRVLRHNQKVNLFHTLPVRPHNSREHFDRRSCEMSLYLQEQALSLCLKHLCQQMGQVPSVITIFTESGKTLSGNEWKTSPKCLILYVCLSTGLFCTGKPETSRQCA